MSEMKIIEKIRSTLSSLQKDAETGAGPADIRILTTGGTFDKVHDPISEKLIFKTNTHLKDMLAEAFVTKSVVIEQIMMKDSLDLSDTDRATIAESIERAEEQKILITHGTSTMTQTADYLANLQKLHDKVIVMTGAFRPYSLMKSDAKFNLGAALAAVQSLPHGVYIAMNGQIFKAGTVRKNVEQCAFESL